MCADSACPCTHAGTVHRYRVAAGGRNSSEGWVTIANATDVPGKPWAPRFASSSSVCACVSDVGVREYDISPPVTTQVWMRISVSVSVSVSGRM